MGNHRTSISKEGFFFRIVFLIIITLNLLLQANTNQFSSSGIGNIKFETISIPDGLSQVTVLSINQDHRGFLWIGTREGLNQYDGYDFIYYKHMGEDRHSLRSNYVSTIYSDSNNNLWIGTDNGLNRYQVNENRFYSYTSEQADGSALDIAHVLAVTEDGQKNIWIGTDIGLFKYMRDQDKFEKIKFRDSEQDVSVQVKTILQVSESTFLVGTSNGLMCLKGGEFVLPSKLGNLGSIAAKITGSIQAMLQDSKEQIWIGAHSGLYKTDKNYTKIQRYTTAPKFSPVRLNSNHISALLEDNKGNIWIGTDRGLTVLNESIGQSYVYNQNSEKRNMISDDVITTLFSDYSGVIWVGTEGGGLSRFDWGQQKFNGFGYISKNGQGLSDRFIYSICEDANQDMWFATNKGINRLSMNKSRFSYYDSEPGSLRKINHNKVRVVRCDHSGKIWVGSYDGINIIDPRTNQIFNLKHIPDEPNSLSDNKIASIYLESPEKVWIGTMLGGLNLYNPVAKTFKYFRHDPNDPNSISNDEIRIINKSANGYIWIGTYGGGLCRFDPGDGTFHAYKNIPGDSSSISSNFIYSIHISENGIIWLGTYGGGLNRFDPEKGIFKRYTVEDGLPNDVVYGILEDRHGCLWLSTNNGLSKFVPNTLDENGNTTTRTVQKFTIGDGLQSNEFNFGAYFQNSSGKMFFGTINGFNFFHPDSIKRNRFIPRVEITGISVLSKQKKKSKFSDANSLLPGKEKLVLSYDDYSFAIKFAALHYSNPEKNKYAYMLEGIDPDWIYTDAKNRMAQYTTITGGEYVFKVKAANNDGIWNEVSKQLLIEIIPPYWEKTWFQIFAILIIIFSSISLHGYRTRLIKKRRDELEKINNQLEKEMLERANAEQALVLSEEKYRGLTENLTVGIFRTSSDSDGSFIEINPSLIKMLGFDSREEAMKVRVKDIYLHPEKRKDFIEKIWNKGSVNDMEVELKKRNGEVIICSISAVAVRNINGKPLYFDGVIEDITERKKVERALIESEVKYRNFVERASDGILIIQDEVVKYINPKLAEMADMTISEILGLKFIDFIHPDEQDKVIDRYKKRISGAKVEKIFETVLVGKSGKEIFAEINAGTINFEGKIADLIFVRDISERRNLEEQIRQVHKMEAIGMLAGGVAHDFNNILTIINGHAELALLKMKREDQNYRLIKEIQKSGQRATSLTRQLLAFSRKQIIEPQILNINGLIANMDKMLRRLIGEDISMKLILTPDMSRLKADPGQLEQVIMNLVINSRDAIHESTDSKKPKFISIETKTISIDEKKVGKFANLIPGKYVCISITDTGNGIESKLIEKIFDPFFTTKETGKGTGLGLSTVFGIIRQNQGNIEVESKVGRGTTFSIYWPAIDSEEVETNYIDTRTMRYVGTENILLVEDDEGVRQFAAVALQDAGYTVIEASNGKEALNKIKKSKPDLDLMVTDMVMPEMNGKELADNIQKSYPKILFLFTSGYTDQDIVQNGSVKSGVHFLQKPYSANVLLAKIREILDN